MTIYFYSTTDEHGFLSNFSRHGFELDGKRWKTVEHYFQAQKFAGTPHAERVRRAATPKEAKRLGNDRSAPLRADWEAVKDGVMRRAVLRKFATHEDLRVLLLASGDEELVENAPNDYYWGCGADGSGKNMLGRILVEVRAELRGEQA
jgi:N-glycosidase YbiA